MKNRKPLIILVIGILIYIFCYWQNNDLVTTKYIYRNNKISDELDGFKIVHISDLHNKEFGKHQNNLLNIVKKENPDAIVITGDIVDSRNTNIASVLSLVKGAIKIAPVFYVTGNHEFRLTNNDWYRLMQGLEHYGVILLDNKFIHISNENSKGFYLIGLSDRNLTDDTLKSLCSSLDTNQLKIVLAHEPHYLNNYKQANVDLILSGHAHGGQFRLPFIGGLIAPNQGLFPKYTSGAYHENDSTMIVSRGLGNSIIPIRIFNRPEVVVITLRKE